MAIFQSTHPAWGGTQMHPSAFDTHSISIHPPRVGWDGFSAAMASIFCRFQSTHPAWGGTRRIAGLSAAHISIHPPRVGWDHGLTRGVARALISIHPPRVGWDDDKAGFADCIKISIHPPRVGWDQSPICCQWQTQNFNPPTPRGVGQTRRRFTASSMEISIHPPRVGWDCPLAG